MNWVKHPDGYHATSPNAGMTVSFREVGWWLYDRRDPAMRAWINGPFQHAESAMEAGDKRVAKEKVK